LAEEHKGACWFSRLPFFFELDEERRELARFARLSLDTADHCYKISSNNASVAIFSGSAWGEVHLLKMPRHMGI
jgi:hypothetical protein